VHRGGHDTLRRARRFGSHPGRTSGLRGEPVSEPEILIQRLDPGLPMPSYAHPGDAGADLYAAEDAELLPGERAVIGTGVAIALPDGYAAFVHPRSGLAARHGVTLVNAPGTIDAGYRGEIRVTLINTDTKEPFRLRRGDRMAQLVFQRVARADFRETGTLPRSARGAGGHGSTGRCHRESETQCCSDVVADVSRRSGSPRRPRRRRPASPARGTPPSPTPTTTGSTWAACGCPTSRPSTCASPRWATSTSASPLCGRRARCSSRRWPRQSRPGCGRKSGRRS